MRAPIISAIFFKIIETRSEFVIHLFGERLMPVVPIV